MLDKLDCASQESGLLVYCSNKTKVMTLRGIPCSIATEGTSIEQVSSFSYLRGSFITDDTAKPL